MTVGCQKMIRFWKKLQLSKWAFQFISKLSLPENWGQIYYKSLACIFVKKVWVMKLDLRKNDVWSLLYVKFVTNHLACGIHVTLMIKKYP